MMLKQNYLIVLSLALFAIFPNRYAKADWAYDTMVFTNSYESAGCSGTYTGMFCRKNNGGRGDTPSELELREDLQRERATTIATTRDALAAIESLLTRPEELLEPFQTLPRSPMFADHKANNVVCLRASLTSLLLLQEFPEVFARFAAAITGSVEGPEIYGFGKSHARRHVLSMYHHASSLVGGSLDLRDAQSTNKMQEMILSQLGPALVQMGYFSNKYELLTNSRSLIPNQDVDETVLSVGFRIGFFSERIDDLGYPFTDRRCGAIRPNLPHVYEITETVNDVAFDNFQLGNVMPASIAAAIVRLGSDEKDDIKALIIAAKDRPSLRLSQIKFSSPTIVELVQRQAFGLPVMREFVELKPGDPVPSYAEMTNFGFAVGNKMFVPSFLEIHQQSDRNLIRLLISGMEVRRMSLDRYIAMYEAEPSTLEKYLNDQVNLLCHNLSCQ